MARIFNSYEDFEPRNTNSESIDYDLEKYSKPIDDLKEEVTPAMEKEYKAAFDRQISFCGNEVYTVGGLYGTDMKQLFLMYCLLCEDIKMTEFAEKMETLRQRREKTSDTRDMEDMLDRSDFAKMIRESNKKTYGNYTKYGDDSF